MLVVFAVLMLRAALVHVDTPHRADAIVLMGSDARGSGEEWVASLVRRRLASRVVLADEPVAWGVTTGYVWSRRLVQLGVPPASITSVPVTGSTPWVDADALGAELSAKGCRNVIVVSNRYDSGRLRFITGRAWRRYGIQAMYCPFPPDPRRNRHGRVRDRAIASLDLALDILWRK